jgi:hypothetical protein
MGWALGQLDGALLQCVATDWVWLNQSMYIYKLTIRERLGGMCQMLPSAKPTCQRKERLCTLPDFFASLCRHS